MKTSSNIDRDSHNSLAQHADYKRGLIITAQKSYNGEQIWLVPETI